MPSRERPYLDEVLRDEQYDQKLVPDAPRRMRAASATHARRPTNPNVRFNPRTSRKGPRFVMHEPAESSFAPPSSVASSSGSTEGSWP
jgi:hypothetical protein